MTHQITLETIGSSRPWVARITGTDQKYGLAREFVGGVRNYSNANSVRTRGVETTYMLADGLYEISAPRTWKRTDRYFARITDGQAETIDAATAQQIALEMEVAHA